MKIEISTGTTISDLEYIFTENDTMELCPCEDTIYEHEGYYDSIDEAIEALQYLKICEERGDFVE